MQKKLIALAITAVFSAPAFADTAVYGVVDGGYGSKATTDQSGTATNGDKTTVSGTTYNQDQTSRVGVKSTEDLGGGMKAGYQLEIGLSGGANVAVDRVLTGSLDLGQGTSVTIGLQSSPFRGIIYGNDAMYGANFVGNLLTSGESIIPGGAYNTTIRLNSRVVAIDVAHNFGAVTASLGLINNTTKTDTSVAATTTEAQGGNGVEVTAVYKQDMLSVSGGYRTQKTTSGPTNNPGTDNTDKMMVLAASFDFGMAKLYGQYGSHDSSDNTAAANSTKVTMESVGVNVPFTPELAAYVQVGTGKVEPNGATTNPKLSAAAVGLHYDMSKNTFAYIHYGTEKLDTVAKVDQYGLGLVHKF